MTGQIISVYSPFLTEKSVREKEGIQRVWHVINHRNR